MSFELDKDEYVIYEARRSWIVLFSQTIGWIFSILIPIILFSAIQSSEKIEFAGNENALLMIFLMSWVFIVWNAIFVVWTDHYLDILVITNKNLIDIEQKGLFVRDIAIVNLSNVEDVTTVVDGVLATLGGYGDLKIQSAGSETEFVLKRLHNPVFVRSKIREAISGDVPRDGEE